MGYVLSEGLGGPGPVVATAATLPVTGATHNVSLMVLIAAFTASVMVASRVITRAMAARQAR